jgi:hypothetical protein
MTVVICLLKSYVTSNTKPDSDPPQRSATAADVHAGERVELDAVLQSEWFRRSPKISRFLSYVCEKYFDGKSDEISEYAIAIEVLGRDSNFDPQTDAIVRVDAHHLRKRLKSFYENEGKDHEIELVIPPGKYTPRFVHRLQVVSGAGKAKQPPVPKSPFPLWMVGAAIVVIGALALSAMRPRKSERPVVVPGGDEIRILAGDRPEYTDKSGRVWLADRFFSGGSTFHRTHDIRRTLDPDIFKFGREGQFAYDIPLKPGEYELRLYFAETGVATENLRGVTVAVNGISRPAIDIVSDAGGPDAATMKVIQGLSPAKDSILHLSFQGNPAFLNAIEILPAAHGKMLPIRFRTSDAPFHDHLGRMWLPDQWFEGGRTSARTNRIEVADDPGLFLTQRYGHFTYSIPVLESGRYTMNLYFSETWFDNSVGGIGSRIFDVYCNGTTLLKNFDVLKDTGGRANRGVVKTFRNLEPTAQGKLVLSFVPVVNYATVSAIEVVQE